MKYIVYQTINLVNNKVYIGVHECENPEVFDGYIGCGVNILNPASYNKPKNQFQYDVKKYGTSNFRRITIIQSVNFSEAYKLLSNIIHSYGYSDRKDIYPTSLTNTSNINQFNKKGELLKRWKSILEAAEFYLIEEIAIISASIDREFCHGYYWSTKDTIDIDKYSNTEIIQNFKENKNEFKIKRLPKRIGMYSLIGDKILEFDTITAACKEYGNVVKKVLKGQQKQCKGFIFKYIS